MTIIGKLLFSFCHCGPCRLFKKVSILKKGQLCKIMKMVNHIYDCHTKDKTYVILYFLYLQVMFRTVYGNNKILNTKLFINQLFLINFLFVRIVSEFNLVKYKSRTEMLLKVLKVFLVFGKSQLCIKKPLFESVIATKVKVYILTSK